MTDSLKEVCEQIWKEYYQEMRKHSHSKLRGHYEDAEDVVQTAFKLLWAKILKSGVPAVPQAWLHKTIKYLVNEKYRQYEKENLCVSLASVEETSLSYIHDIDEEIAKEQLYSELLELAKHELSDEEKTLINYSIFEKRENKETATLLGISETAVKQRRYRLMRKTHQMSERKKKELNFF